MKAAAAAGTGLLILPSGTRIGAAAPSNKLNVALIGAHGRAMAHYDPIAEENVVALCDVNEDHIALAAERFPKAKRYIDWRKCLEQKNLDAIICCTTDHTHAFVSTWAMNRGLHVYCEKPLANSVAEARLVRETYLKNKDKVATQCGMQRHAHENFQRVSELIRDGIIGELEEVHAWGNRQIPKPGYLPAEGKPPKTLHYDLWLGPSPFHPYNPGYFQGAPGANCLCWNMYWDFGSGQTGDMGSHTMDIVWCAIDAEQPTSAEATGDPFNPEVTPVELTATFEHPANAWRPPIRVTWHQGGSMPTSPGGYLDLSKIGHGAMFKGSKGVLVSSFSNRIIIPGVDEADLTYYKPRTRETLIPPIAHFQHEWTNACKGNLQTTCNFDYAGTMIEQLLLGLVAYRAGTRLEYDGASGRITNNAEANALLSRSYRDGWVLNG
ncbi:MAG TPA: Gfo/Idh/MocA family oxidoreductase [Candidatus Hydrogenedentes bacterium]|jgi:predicted dehydrogenase|nr:Gfo/Idh/MocA family oxidoreductase [Candidatus Hydrogenedentota bacterium]